MVEEPKDCFQCRLTGGGGLLAGAAYVLYQRKKFKTFYRHFLTAFGCGLGVLGMLRLFALPPFKSRVEVQKKDLPEGVEENEYIIGKFPPKLH